MSNNLAFSLQNDQQDPVIHITSDPASNKLTFTIANLGNQALQLKGGTPIAETQRNSDSPSTLYLTFGPLLTPTEFQNLSWSAEGWCATYFTDGGLINWGLTPQQNLEIPAQGNVSFSLNNVTASHRPMNGFLTVDYYNLGENPDNSFQITVLLQTQPVEGHIPLKIKGGFLNGNQITISSNAGDPVSNKLSFFLSNPDLSHPIVPDSTPWESDLPIFILSFVLGLPPGFGALTTVQMAADITINPNGQSATKWEVIPLTDTLNPSWQLLPQSHEVLGIGPASIVEFEIDDIVSQLESGPTSMYLQWDNIPGYNPGFTSFIIEKVSPPKINRFYSFPGFVQKDGVPVKLGLGWEVEHAKTLEIRTPQGDYIVTDKKSLQLPKPIHSSTAFTLSATGRNGTIVDQILHFNLLDFKLSFDVVKGLPEKVNFVEAVYSPKWDLAYFLAWDKYLYVVDTQQNKVLSRTMVWNVIPLSVSPSIDDKFDRLYTLSTHSGRHIRAFNVDRSGKVSLFKEIETQLQGTCNIGVSPDGQTVYIAGNNKAVGYFHLSDYVMRYGPAILEDHKPGTKDMVVSPDGKYLYLAIGEDTVQQINLSQWTLGPSVKVEKSNSLHLLISLDGKQVYASSHIGDTVTVIYPEEKFRTKVIPVERPVRLAMSPDGATVYALQVPNNISMIDVATSELMYNLTINPDPNRPRSYGYAAIVAATNGKKLYLGSQSQDVNLKIAQVDIEEVDPLPSPRSV